MDCFATLAMTTMEEIASRSLSSGAHSCDPLARNDEDVAWIASLTFAMTTMERTARESIIERAFATLWLPGTQSVR